MTYKIKYDYETGDSFGHREETGVLEMEWKYIENAKSALERIESHYDWYDFNNRWSRYTFSKEKPPAEPDWHKGEKYDFTVKVMLDNGNEVKFCAPWCGYFERLHNVEIFEV